jgi:hypothetical protein
MCKAWALLMPGLLSASAATGAAAGRPTAAPVLPGGVHMHQDCLRELIPVCVRLVLLVEDGWLHLNG